MQLAEESQLSVSLDLCQIDESLVELELVFVSYHRLTGNNPVLIPGPKTPI
jgi:hypothetical protein